jgi:hypothetical protein
MYCKHMSHQTIWWLAISTLTMAVGCPDDGRGTSDRDADEQDAGTAGRPDSVGLIGVPMQSPLSELSDSDSMKVCQGFEDDYNAAISATTRAQMRCLERVIPMTLMGGGSAGRSIDVPKCEELVDRCLGGEQIAEPGPNDAKLVWNLVECDDAGTARFFGECDATVAEFEACAEEAVAIADQRLREQDCQGLQDRLVMPVTTSAEPPSDACKAVREKCGWGG